MKIKWGALVTDGRGKIGGQVASKNRSGAYMRTKVTPSNPQTAAQLAVRSILAGLSSGWRGLTQDQRDGWNGAVNDFQKTNVFGDITTPTGKNLYTRLNASLQSVGLSVISSAPSPDEVIECTIPNFAFTLAPTTAAINVTNLDSNMKYQVIATAPVSAGKSFVKSEYRQIGTMLSTDTQPFDIATAYTDKFGTPAEGKKVFVKVVPVVIATGQQGVGATANTIVTA